MPLSEADRRALEILKRANGVPPSAFARSMWPESDGHSNMTNCGRGVTRGGGMNLAAGGFLGKLAKKGLARRGVPDARNWYLTVEGERALAEPATSEKPRSA